jgi:hypothetical protein
MSTLIIWEMTVETVRKITPKSAYRTSAKSIMQRIVDVRQLRHQTEPHGHLITSTPIPATLQSCREARNHGLYDRVFFEVDAQEKGTSEQRYVWLNLDIDVMDIGTSEFRYFAYKLAHIDAGHLGFPATSAKRDSCIEHAISPLIVTTIATEYT